MISYMGEKHDIDINSQVQCNEVISQYITTKILTSDMVQKFTMLKISKNHNIKDKVETLLKNELKNYCLFAYGPHIQKLLSVVEIFKSRQPDIKWKQYNKIQNFDIVKNGPNELIDKKISIPILICFIISDDDLSANVVFEDERNQFTKQVI